MNRRSAVMVSGVLLAGCGPDVSEPPDADGSGNDVGHSTMCPPGSLVWMGAPVCSEGNRAAYDRDAFGSSSRYQKWEDEIIAGLLTSGGGVHAVLEYAVRHPGRRYRSH